MNVAFSPRGSTEGEFKPRSVVTTITLGEVYGVIAREFPAFIDQYIEDSCFLYSASPQAYAAEDGSAFLDFWDNALNAINWREVIAQVNPSKDRREVLAPTQVLQLLDFAGWIDVHLGALPGYGYYELDIPPSSNRLNAIMCNPFQIDPMSVPKMSLGIGCISIVSAAEE